jgi:hypothetical protein
MAFHLSGLKPTAPEGTEFNSSIFNWHPLAKFCCTSFPAIALRLQPLELAQVSAVAEPISPHTVILGWFFNEGNLLSVADALALADAIDASIASGAAARYLALHLNDSYELTERITASMDAVAGGALDAGGGLTLDRLRAFSALPAPQAILRSGEDAFR